MATQQAAATSERLLNAKKNMRILLHGPPVDEVAEYWSLLNAQRNMHFLLLGAEVMSLRSPRPMHKRLRKKPRRRLGLIRALSEEAWRSSTGGTLVRALTRRRRLGLIKALNEEAWRSSTGGPLVRALLLATDETAWQPDETAWQPDEAACSGWPSESAEAAWSGWPSESALPSTPEPTSPNTLWI